MIGAAAHCLGQYSNVANKWLIVKDESGCQTIVVVISQSACLPSQYLVLDHSIMHGSICVVRCSHQLIAGHTRL